MWAYLEARIKGAAYRGLHVSQQNRLPPTKIRAVLSVVWEVAGDSTVELPPGDMGHFDPARYPAYMELVSRLRADGVEVTPNSLKKNIFPDLDRMGLLPRTRVNKQWVAQLSAHGKAVTTSDAFQQAELMASAYNRLVAPVAPAIAELCDRCQQVTTFEIMLFATDLATSVHEKEALIRSYRKLGLPKRLALHARGEALCRQMTVASAGAKTEKRDWHNWWNQSKQIVSLLAYSSSFDVLDGEFVTLRGQASLGATTWRSREVTQDALEWHGLAERPAGFDLHHVFPLAYVVHPTEVRLVDCKENLLCIRRAIHKKFRLAITSVSNCGTKATI